MSDIKLGTVPSEGQKRDAIHIAIIPVVAGQDLLPGDHVKMLNNVAVEAGRDSIGVVDPFLKEDVVEQGQWFYLLLYQQTITGMRHHWSHPAFPDEEPKPVEVVSPDQFATSELWLRKFCDTHDCPDYKALIKISTGNFEPDDYIGGEITEDYFYCSGVDGHCDIPMEFWTHLKIVTGLPFPHQPNQFSCSC